MGSTSVAAACTILPSATVCGRAKHDGQLWLLDCRKALTLSGFPLRQKSQHRVEVGRHRRGTPERHKGQELAKQPDRIVHLFAAVDMGFDRSPQSLDVVISVLANGFQLIAKRMRRLHPQDDHSVKKKLDRYRTRVLSIRCRTLCDQAVESGVIASHGKDFDTLDRPTLTRAIGTKDSPEQLVAAVAELPLRQT